MKNLENYIESINATKSPEEAFDTFCSIMNKYGYNRVTYSLVTDHPSLDLPRLHGLATSYPEDWMKYYNENNYLDVDPVVAGVAKSRKPFFWDDLNNDPNISDPSLKLMEQAREAGLKDGIAIPLFGKTGEIVGLGLARDEEEDNKRDYEFLAGAYLLSTYFHETFRDMLLKPIRTKITNREKEILSWAAEGKTDEEIGMLLSISMNTVRYHWKKIFSKLDANGRIYAVTKAIRLELIVPQSITNPYQKR